jgi:hypothetical protein
VDAADLFAVLGDVDVDHTAAELEIMAGRMRRSTEQRQGGDENELAHWVPPFSKTGRLLIEGRCAA